MESSGTRPNCNLGSDRINKTENDAKDGRCLRPQILTATLPQSETCDVKYYCIQYLQLQWLAAQTAIVVSD
jgi:hypothetical protein